LDTPSRFQLLKRLLDLGSDRLDVEAGRGQGSALVELNL
jgi:hypothetical protein